MNNEIVATPKLGIAKGIIIMLLGFMWLNNYSLGALLSYRDTGSKGILWGGVIWGWGIFGLCLWRGIVAILQRKKKRVTSFNMGILAVLFALTLAYVLYILH